MSWKVNVTLPEEEGGVGTISAIWEDSDLPMIPVEIDGEIVMKPRTFTYSRRARVSVAAADRFIVEAVAARDAWQDYQTNNIAKSAWALDRLNTADPKVV